MARVVVLAESTVTPATNGWIQATPTARVAAVSAEIVRLVELGGIETQKAVRDVHLDRCARGIKDVCLTGRSISVWWRAFCAIRCATRRANQKGPVAVLKAAGFEVVED